MATLKIVHRSEKYHDDGAYYDLISYCCRRDKTPKRLVGGIAVDVPYAAAQMEMVTLGFPKMRGIKLRRFILSFDRKEESAQREPISWPNM